MLIVSVLSSRNQKWTIAKYTKDLDEAIATASALFAERVNGNAYVQIKIEQQVK